MYFLLGRGPTKIRSALLTWFALGPGPGQCSSLRSELPLTVLRIQPLTPSSVGDLHFSTHLRLSCASVFESLGLYLCWFPPTLYSRNAKKRKSQAEVPLQGVVFSLIPPNHSRGMPEVSRWGLHTHTLPPHSGFLRQSKILWKLTWSQTLGSLSSQYQTPLTQVSQPLGWNQEVARINTPNS